MKKHAIPGFEGYFVDESLQVWRNSGGSYQAIKCHYPKARYHLIHQPSRKSFWVYKWKIACSVFGWDATKRLMNKQIFSNDIEYDYSGFFPEYLFGEDGSIYDPYRRGELTPVYRKKHLWPNSRGLLFGKFFDAKGVPRFVCAGRLILSVFKGIPPSSNHICFFKDGNKENLEIKNLEWRDRNSVYPRSRLRGRSRSRNKSPRHKERVY